jgi:SAM-dependent methyltransferase
MTEYLWEQTAATEDEELERLQVLQALYDPGTLPRLEAVGVTTGWTCAEVGAGAGSVADWLCRRVGPSGRVVALDLTTRYLAWLQHDNLEVRGADINGEPLEKDTYDLVHARMLLEHLPNREEVVAGFAAAVRPGGLVVAADVVLTGAGATHPPSELIDRLNDAFTKGFAFVGGDMDFGLKLPGAMTAAGLEDVQAVGYVPIAFSGTPSVAFQTLGLLRTAPMLVEAGLLTQDDVEQGLEAVRTPGMTLFAPALITTWARRPA